MGKTVFGGKSRSTTQEAKKVVREEIKKYFNPREYGVRSTVDAMKKDADAYNADRRGWASNYDKGAALVDAGSLACYHSDQSVMLGKIYGKEHIANWNGEKIHNTYKHLIGREYNAMLTEQERKKSTRKVTAKKATKPKVTAKKATKPAPKKSTAKAKTKTATKRKSK